VKAPPGIREAYVTYSWTQIVKEELKLMMDKSDIKEDRHTDTNLLCRYAESVSLGASDARSENTANKAVY
jgi:hypothetical protein